jgi:hypothetical protein
MQGRRPEDVFLVDGLPKLPPASASREQLRQALQSLVRGLVKWAPAEISSDDLHLARAPKLRGIEILTSSTGRAHTKHVELTLTTPARVVVLEAEVLLLGEEERVQTVRCRVRGERAINTCKLEKLYRSLTKLDGERIRADYRLDDESPWFDVVLLFRFDGKLADLARDSAPPPPPPPRSPSPSRSSSSVSDSDWSSSESGRLRSRSPPPRRGVWA